MFDKLILIKSNTIQKLYTVDLWNLIFIIPPEIIYEDTNKPDLQKSG